MGHVSILLDKMRLDDMRLDEIGINQCKYLHVKIASLGNPTTDPSYHSTPELPLRTHPM